MQIVLKVINVIFKILVSNPSKNVKTNIKPNIGYNNPLPISLRHFFEAGV